MRQLSHELAHRLDRQAANPSMIQRRPRLRHRSLNVDASFEDGQQTAIRLQRSDTPVADGWRDSGNPD